MEDEVLIAETLRLYIQERGHIFIDFAISHNEAINLIAKESPDIILLDIRLYGEKSGIDIANYLLIHQISIPYIYLTSQYDKRILDEALLTKPGGYLTKPIQKETLWTTLELAYSNFHDKDETGSNSFSVNNGNEVQKVDENKIVYIESDHVYIRIHMDDGSQVLTRSSMTHILALLNAQQFIQCHRSFIINTEKINKWTSTGVEINGKEIPVSRSRRNDLKQILHFVPR